MTTPSLRTVTLKTLANYRHAAERAVGAYRAGGERLIAVMRSSVDQAAQRGAEPYVPGLAAALRRVGDNMGDLATKGLGAVSERSERAIQFSAAGVTAQVKRVADLADGVDNRVVATSLQAAVRISLPGAQAALALSERVASGADKLADVAAGAKPRSQVARQGCLCQASCQQVGRPGRQPPAPRREDCRRRREAPRSRPPWPSRSCAVPRPRWTRPTEAVAKAVKAVTAQGRAEGCQAQGSSRGRRHEAGQAHPRQGRRSGAGRPGRRSHRRRRLTVQQPAGPADADATTQRTRRRLPGHRHHARQRQRQPAAHLRPEHRARPARCVSRPSWRTSRAGCRPRRCSASGCMRVPLGLDHPYWVDDEHFDLEYHVRHIALPKPGDWRQFCIQVSRIHARALDLNRPLWEIYVIEGLDSFLDLPEGSFALLTKTHLAAVDLRPTGRAEQPALRHLSATPAPRHRRRPGSPKPARRGCLVRRGLVNLRHRAAAPGAPAVAGGHQLAPAASWRWPARCCCARSDMPATRFNAMVSPHRVFETRRFTEAEFEAIRALVPGATLDDAVAAVIGGACAATWTTTASCRRPTAWRPSCPRAAPDGPAPQQLRWRACAPGHRHRRRPPAPDHPGRPGPGRARRGGPPAGQPGTGRGQRAGPAALLAWSRRLVGRASARLGSSTPPANCTLAHLPAPTQPMFLCGARLSYFSAILPITDGLGLAFAVTRYDGRLVISPTSCRELMPDPEVFAQCVRDSFQEYLALTVQRPVRRIAAAKKAAKAVVKPKMAARPGRPAAAPAPTAARPRASSAGRARRATRPG
jgi:diacylglycerol O-acyltransferase